MPSTASTSAANNEPVAIAALGASVIDAVAAFGLINSHQVAALVALITAAVPLAFAFWARSKVKPVA